MERSRSRCPCLVAVPVRRRWCCRRGRVSGERLGRRRGRRRRGRSGRRRCGGSDRRGRSHRSRRGGRIHEFGCRRRTRERVFHRLSGRRRLRLRSGRASSRSEKQSGDRHRTLSHAFQSAVGHEQRELDAVLFVSEAAESPRGDASALAIARRHRLAVASRGPHPPQLPSNEGRTGASVEKRTRRSPACPNLSGGGGS